MFTLGARLPDPYYAWVVERKIGFARLRRCLGCGHMWTTMEVPLYVSWDGGAANLCPKHPYIPTLVVDKCGIGKARKGNLGSEGTWKILSFGGYYRRRACASPVCTDRKGRPSRWTTGEYAAEGTIVADITKCPRCDGHGQCLTKPAIATLSRKERNRLWERQYRRKQRRRRRGEGARS